MVLAPATFLAPRRLGADGMTNSNVLSPATTASATARRLHLAVVMVALVFAIYANTMMVSSTLPSGFRRSSQSFSKNKANVRHGSPSVRPFPLVLAQDDPKLEGVLITNPKQRRLLKRVTRLRHKLEAAVLAVQKQLDGATATDGGSDPTNV